MFKWLFVTSKKLAGKLLDSKKETRCYNFSNSLGVHRACWWAGSCRVCDGITEAAPGLYFLVSSGLLHHRMLLCCEPPASDARPGWDCRWTLDCDRLPKLRVESGNEPPFSHTFTVVTKYHHKNKHG